MNTHLPNEAVETDRRLEDAATRSTDELAKHRWHWTLDESNPHRVNVNEYARQVGRGESSIRVMVDGYARFVTDASGTNLDEYIGKARMSGETAAAATAVAKARGISPRTAQDSRSAYHNETRRVRDVARQLAEERGTSIEEEAPKVAETIVRAEKAEQAVQAERAAHADMRFFEMERYLISAKRELMRAVKLAPQVPWDDEHREMLTETVANVKALLGMLDSAIAGISGTDWDAELAKLGAEQ